MLENIAVYILLGVVAFLLGMIVGQKTNPGEHDPTLERVLSLVRWAIEKKTGSFPPTTREDPHVSDLEKLFNELEQRRKNKNGRSRE